MNPHNKGIGLVRFADRNTVMWLFKAAQQHHWEISSTVFWGYNIILVHINSNIKMMHMLYV